MSPERKPRGPGAASRDPHLSTELWKQARRVRKVVEFCDWLLKGNCDPITGQNCPITMAKGACLGWKFPLHFEIPCRNVFAYPQPASPDISAPSQLPQSLHGKAFGYFLPSITLRLTIAGPHTWQGTTYVTRYTTAYGRDGDV